MLRKIMALAVFGALALMPLSASAATTTQSLSLSTQYPGLVVDPGKTATFAIAVSGTVGDSATLGTTGLPDGWTASFRGAGSTVNEVMVQPSVTTATPVQPDLKLDVDVPADAKDGSYDFVVTAGSARLPLTVTVQPGASKTVALTPDFPGLRGPNDSDFIFNVTLQNQSATDVTLQLAGTGPDGWTVTAEPSTQAKASSITVAAGQTASVKLTAKAPSDAKAGTYDVGMTASGSGVDASLGVKVELVGNVSLQLTTPDGRLNADVTAGKATQVPIVVVNSGSADLAGVVLSATPPKNWDVTFSPSTVDAIPAGQSVTVNADITAAGDAIAGDYDITFTANADTASDSMDVRTTVSPSAVWGIVGVGLVALTLAGLSFVFRRFGRR